MYNQWPSACSVNNLDKMGWPGGGSTAKKHPSNRGMTVGGVKRDNNQVDEKKMFAAKGPLQYPKDNC